MNGSLFLRAGLRDGRTVLLESHGTYPLQVLRPHAGASQNSLSLILLLLSAGLLDGDCISVDVVLERGARLSLRTQAATQVHAGRSEQRLLASVAEDGCFSYVPHAVVPHANADYHALMRISLAAGARVLIADSLSPGRVHFGERFAYREVRLDLDITRDGALVARERALVRPDAALRSAQWGTFSHVASAYLVGAGEEPCLAAVEDARVGATQLAGGGWLVRALATRAAAIDTILNTLTDHWWRACAL